MFSEFTCSKVKPYSLQAKLRQDKHLCHEAADHQKGFHQYCAGGKKKQLVVSSV